MKDTITFKFDDKSIDEKPVSIAQLGRFLMEFDSLLKRLSIIDIKEIERSVGKNQLSPKQIEDYYSAVKKPYTGRFPKHETPNIQKISKNSPLEIVILVSVLNKPMVNLGILLLGGERTGRNAFTIKKGLLEALKELIESIRKR